MSELAILGGQKVANTDIVPIVKWPIVTPAMDLLASDPHEEVVARFFQTKRKN